MWRQSDAPLRVAVRRDAPRLVSGLEPVSSISYFLDFLEGHGRRGRSFSLGLRARLLSNNLTALALFFFSRVSKNKTFAWNIFLLFLFANSSILNYLNSNCTRCMRPRNMDPADRVFSWISLSFIKLNSWFIYKSSIGAVYISTCSWETSLSISWDNVNFIRQRFVLVVLPPCILLISEYNNNCFYHITCIRGRRFISMLIVIRLNRTQPK